MKRIQNIAASKTIRRARAMPGGLKRVAVEACALAACLALLAALPSGFFARTASAQDIVSPVAQETSAPGTYVIRNARIMTVSGPDIENGTLVISGGKITGVGANASAPAGATEIDARGLFVYPGMIDAGTSMALVEIGSGAPGTVDTSELGDMNPNAMAWVALNPHSAHLDVTRFAGVTNAVSLPQGGIISGQAAFINLNGTTQRELALIPTIALVVNFPTLGGGGGGGGFAAQQGITPDAVSARERRVDELRRMLRDAEAYGRAQDAYARDEKSVPRPTTDVKLAALAPYARGERPVIFRADRERDIRASLRFAEEMKLKPIILGGSEAWKVTSLLKEKNVAVVLDGVLNLPLREDDAYDTLYENASKLQAAGVRFAISTGDSGAHVRDLPFHAGMAAAYGLPRNEALKAVTLYPAQIMGVADRLGSLEAGKIANVVVTDGDILEARTNVRHLFIAGRQIPLVSRHTLLYDQFKDRK
ncbi:MAG: amidohydrolase family protein [Acidobacteria bacterium]|nr:amidohydrolase family protein [Acidobacteriota bacterium]